MSSQLVIDRVGIDRADIDRASIDRRQYSGGGFPALPPWTR
jgi:hypothetical protein